MGIFVVSLHGELLSRIGFECVWSVKLMNISKLYLINGRVYNKRRTNIVKLPAIVVLFPV
jgi:hypothetical protein